MEHREAIELRAAEKYVLRELPADLQEAYEEHFLDCAECAADIQAATVFAETSRRIFAEEGNRPAVETKRASVWSRWLRPVIAVPVFATALVLLLVVGYESSRTAPKSTQIAAVTGQLAVPNALQNSVKLLGDEHRGESAVALVKVHPGDGFTLNFDFLPSQQFDSYLGELRDAAGHVLLPVTLSGDTFHREVNVPVPGGLVKAGNYTLAFVGVPAVPNPASNDTRVESFTFTVEFIQ
jgi:hypothetical protein